MKESSKRKQNRDWDSHQSNTARCWVTRRSSVSAPKGYQIAPPLLKTTFLVVFYNFTKMSEK